MLIKKIAIPVIVILAIIISLFLFTNVAKKIKTGGIYSIGDRSLIGSSTNYQSLPNSAVNANSTTTDSGVVADAGLVNQYISIDGSDRICFEVGAVGGTATSTAHMQPIVSSDGSNYFNYTNSTTTSQSATSTLDITRTSFDFIPGTASTTFTWCLDGLEPFKNMRLMMYQDNLSTDPNDGVQAWIKYNLQMED